MPDVEDTYSMVDLGRFVEDKQLEKFSDKCYIERVLKSDDSFSELYPVVTRPDNFEQPYLTPQKHLEYSTFWGITAAMGYSSLIWALLRL